MSYYRRWKLDAPATERLRQLTGVPDSIALRREAPHDLQVPPKRQLLDKSFAGSAAHAQCLCGKPTRYLGGDPDSFMSYLCEGCQYCYRNCDCPGSARARRPSPSRITTLPDGIWWHVWNSGLFGDERASEVPHACYLRTPEKRGYVVPFPTYAAVYKFVIGRGVLALTLKPVRIGQGMLAGVMQLPTIYSSSLIHNTSPYRQLLANTVLWHDIDDWYGRYAQAGAEGG